MTRETPESSQAAESSQSSRPPDGAVPSEGDPAQGDRAAAVRRTLPAHFRDKSALADTAGVSWAGRDYATSPFPGDDGSAPAPLAAALADVRAGHDADLRRLAAALRGTRLLVPIMAEATEKGTTAHGLTGDNGADMAMVMIRGADGSSALPLFSSVAELAAWRRDARPVPVVAEQAAQAAVQEGCTALLLDPATPRDASGAPIVLQRSILWALAQGRAWTPPAVDPEVVAELSRITALVPGVLDLEARPGSVREVDLAVRLHGGLDADGVRAVVARLSEALGASAIVAERITSLKLVLEG